MRTATITAIFSSDVQKVWNVVTDNKNYSWRSDLSKIEIVNDNNFIEYTKNRFQTLFTIIVKEPYERYEFDMKNKNISGHWTGVFTKTAEGGTQIDFTEEIEIANPVIRVLSYLFMNLKGMQKTYVADLRKVLGE
ncbi:hypothetical protein DP145_06335 [Clostridium tetani]|uniref:SRPBCC family protein n=1 Tax=Clostridium tetani TaxID=1513 RepID=UPI00100BF0BA|nr:SRPBCC family protein [Clostridium tetani]RXI45613.1 hypothetical protein DP126_08725 [Clostridium tetani]RXM60607.1 hypothetical protein DP138_08090 [Clostridium tetani]RXM68015.1 hypothetical protein DP145_06335 [Clostridium tetani]